MSYEKLVRDRIPHIIRENGGEPKTRRLDTAEYMVELIRKLHEEADEFAADMSLAERADIQEVLFAIDEELGFTPSAIEEARRDKADRNGAFKSRIYLEGIEGEAVDEQE